MKVVISIIESLALKYGFNCSISHTDKDLGIFHLQRDYIYIAVDIEFKEQIRVNMVSRPYKVLPIWKCSIHTLEQTLIDKLNLF